jgi:hypothetical protein
MYVQFRCKGFCFLCNCPLNVYIKSNNYEVRELIRKYRNIRPIWLYNNETYYKFFGQSLKRVCFSCFERVKTPDFKKIRDFEIGKVKSLKGQCYSLTTIYLQLWYISLQKYICKNFKNRQMIVYNDI